MPASAQQSKTEDDRDAQNGAGNAIDLKLHTWSIAVPDSTGFSWLQINLQEVHCVKRVKRFTKNGNLDQRFKCSSETKECSCIIGELCSRVQLTVNTNRTSVSDLPVEANCRYGDNVRLAELEVGALSKVIDLAIIGSRGEWELLAKINNNRSNTRKKAENRTVLFDILVILIVKVIAMLWY